MDILSALRHLDPAAPPSDPLPTPPEAHSFERVPVVVYPDSLSASKKVAHEIADLIRAKQEAGQQAVLGLATGSTPTDIYAELVRLHREASLSFRNVVTFNLDEYYPLPHASPQSYHHFMSHYLFSQVDIPPENVHIPDGALPPEAVEGHCAAYEAAIREAGGIDLQLLGIGTNGHIAFNEPGSSRDSRTRVVALSQSTRAEAASDFFGEANVPRRALSMGVATIMQARRVVLMAVGEAKAMVTAKAVEGPCSGEVPASFLQQHPAATFVLDPAAAAKLTRMEAPWRVGPCDWDGRRMLVKAATWLSGRVGCALLKLTDAHYAEQGLGDLLARRGGAYDINLTAFRALQAVITGWPGGKPGEDDSRRPERAAPHPKRVLVFSPHPDDDVICMGGTLSRLITHGHQVHVAYQTSGSIAVHNDDALRFTEFLQDIAASLQLPQGDLQAFAAKVSSAVGPGAFSGEDSLEVGRVKALIRQGEARAAVRLLGVTGDRVHFLNLPFYETGKVLKKPLGVEDVQLVARLLQELQPHQVYAAGDLTDPHGTHRVCLQALLLALQGLRGEPWLADCRLWLYRGAWQEWGVEAIDMVVPLSPKELELKRSAIFKHQSQKDRPLFPGNDKREFWQRAEARNRATARQFDALGLPEYEALEAFVRCDLP